MINLLYNINKKGLPLVPTPTDNIASATVGGIPRVLYLSLLAVLVAAAGALVSWLITPATTAFIFGYYGDVTKDISGSDELGPIIILIPIIGAVLLTWLSRYTAPVLKAAGLTVAIGTGAPMGVDSPAMIFNGAIGKWAGKIFRCTPEECYILFVAGTSSTLGSLFGAPVAAVFLVLEIFFSTFTLYNILPVICAAATAGVASYLLRGTKPVYSIEAAPGINGKTLLAYIAVGLIIGLWARLQVKLSKVIGKWFGKLTAYNRWYLLGAALIVGIAGYISPRALGAGNHYINDLLKAHVTLSILFGLAIMKLVAWLFFSSAYKTGSGITPLLITGGAASLLIGVVIQLLFPSLIIHSGTLVLVGMAAMLAGTSRAVLTAVVLSLELTHDVNTVLPVLGACIIAYSVSIYSRKKAPGN